MQGVSLCGFCVCAHARTCMHMCEVWAAQLSVSRVSLRRVHVCVRAVGVHVCDLCGCVPPPPLGPLLFSPPPGQLGSMPSEVYSLSGSSPGHPSSQQSCLILFIHKLWLTEEMRRSWEWGQSSGKRRAQVCSSYLKPSLAPSCCPIPTPHWPRPSPFLP